MVSMFPSPLMTIASFDDTALNLAENETSRSQGYDGIKGQPNHFPN